MKRVKIMCKGNILSDRIIMIIGKENTFFKKPKTRYNQGLDLLSGILVV